MAKAIEKYTMISHSWKRLVAGKQVCNTCGLVALNNEFTRWAIDKGCDNHLHPEYERVKNRFTKLELK